MNDKALIYGRLSKGDASLESHEKRNVDYCAYKQFAIERRFEDEDTSGGIALLERNGGRALFNRLRQGDIRHVVVAKLDRLGRYARDVLKTIETLQEMGVVLHIVDFGGDTISTQGHMGKLILTIFAGIAEWERSEIRDRVQKRMDHKFNRGELTGNVPYGFDALYTFADRHEHTSPKALNRDELAPLITAHGPVQSKLLVDNPGEQQWVRRIAEMRKTMNLNQLAQWLNANGVKPKLPAGTLIKSHGHNIISSGRWSTGNVDSLLKSRHTEKILSNAEGGARNAEAA